GVGVGVNVANVDGTAEASVEDSKIYSVSDVKVDAKENRAVTSFNGNTAAGFGAVGANVSVVTVGQEIDEASYQSAYDWTNADGTTETRTVKAKDDAGAEISAAYDKAQTVIEDGELLSSQAFGYAGIPAKQDVTLSRGGQASAVTAAMENSSVLSGGNIKVASAEHTDVKIEQYGFGAGVASVNGTVAVLDTNRNAATKVDGSSLTAYGNIDVTSDVSGTAGASAIQGTAGAAAALNGAFAFSDAANSSHLEIVGSNLGAYHMAHLAAKDSSQTELDAISVAGAGAGAIGVQVAEATTKSAAEGVDILINNSTIAALGTDAKYRPLDENGNIGDKDAIPITSWDHAVTIEAENTQTMKTNLTTVDAALAGAASVAVSEVKAGWVEKDDDTNKLKTSVTVKGNSTLKSEADEKNAIYVGAKADIAQEASMTAVDVALVGAVSVNYDGADTNSDVSVSLGENTRYDAGNGALIAKGETNLSQKLDAEGVDVSVSTISVGVGNNAVNANNTLQTTVDAGAPSVSSRLGAAELSAVSEADTSVRAQSYGGSILNVAAAEADNTLTNTTAVNIGGTWDMKSGDFIATAQNKEKLDVEADTLAAAIVDGSGASIHSKAEETATVNLKNATVTTAQGAQIYTAENVVDDSLDIDASGYGGV
ncbi:MAG: hypothetical protein IJK04_04010, partial [Kiritimatiellae bacterium]|nr:hypothetical protein [Kiritimatiellia bacterium]